MTHSGINIRCEIFTQKRSLIRADALNAQMASKLQRGLVHVDDRISVGLSPRSTLFTVEASLWEHLI